MRRILLLLLVVAAVSVRAQRPAYGKMSPLVRRLAADEAAFRGQRSGLSRVAKRPVAGSRPSSVCAFVQIAGDAGAVLAENGCRKLAQAGDICIADIPVGSLARLSGHRQVARIEAGQRHTALLDTALIIPRVPPLHRGEGLSQAFTGKGVLVGLEDVGFDLTHPTFMNEQLTECRIRRFWDQLSADTVGSRLFVGSEYTNAADILRYAHSRDAYAQGHGTHTLGVAAGTGYDTAYRGVAYESDICLVSNAVTSDTVFIAPADREKYTSATDALGFKYIFDYADELNMPCVISFSEGSHQDFHGDDQLLYAFLERLVGPGRIIVASAGNEGELKTYFRKPRGTHSAGSFFRGGRREGVFTLKADGPFALRAVAYAEDGRPDTLSVSTEHILHQPDSALTDTLHLPDTDYVVHVEAYVSCYDDAETAYDVTLKCADGAVGKSCPLSVEVVGSDADVHFFLHDGTLLTNEINPLLAAGESTHSIYSPGSAPGVICVGATTCRNFLRLASGAAHQLQESNADKVAVYSSVGPTLDGRIKPDVVAPGTMVVSGWSSFHYETFPEDYWQVAFSQYNGRTYPWRSEIGTSMSTPLVAGIIALWMQARPTLSPAEAVQVLAATCRHNDETLEYPNNYYGYGEIDAHAGLLHLLGLSGLPHISNSRPQQLSLHLSADGGMQLLLDAPAAQPFVLSIYALDGRRVGQWCFDAGSSRYALSLSALPRGVYAVQIDSRQPGIGGSLLIRR